MLEEVNWVIAVSASAEREESPGSTGQDTP